ncbi:hypothetical protein ACIHFC_37050 [Streptomyces sp. NPDC052013]|uniref:hypothetical protein n=1 Tax=Streptomyces sp. NPDC052013 TaxID=3365679 RepID=UPI0037CE80FF
MPSGAAAPAACAGCRQRAVSELRAQGRYGPELRDVFPGFIVLGLAVLAPVLLLAWLYKALDVGGLALGVILLAAAVAAGWRLRRTVVRRRGGHYTAAELAQLNDHGLAAAAARMLRRDGWRVVDLTVREGRPRLYARDRRGRKLDVAFRPVASAAATDEGARGPAPLRDAGRPGVDRLIRVVVHLGGFSRADVLWASRQGGVHLLDGRPAAAVGERRHPGRSGPIRPPIRVTVLCCDFCLFLVRRTRGPASTCGPDIGAQYPTREGLRDARSSGAPWGQARRWWMVRVSR